MTRYLPASTNAPGRPRIPAFRNSRASRTRIKRGRGFASRKGGGAWRLLIFSFDSRRPDIPTSRQPQPRLGTPDSTDVENERTAMVQICCPGLHHPFLAFWPSIGFKAGDFVTKRHEREACCVALPRFKQSEAPSVAHAL